MTASGHVIAHNAQPMQPSLYCSTGRYPLTFRWSEMRSTFFGHASTHSPQLLQYSSATVILPFAIYTTPFKIIAALKKSFANRVILSFRHKGERLSPFYGAALKAPLRVEARRKLRKIARRMFLAARAREDAVFSTMTFNRNSVSEIFRRNSSP